MFYAKFSAEFDELSVFFLKATGSDQKMNKTEVVPKNANKHHSEAKDQEASQDSRGSPIRGFFRHFFNSFSFSNAKGLTSKAFLEVSFSFINP